MHELLELVRASGERDDDVDEHIGCVHSLVFHLQEWSEGPEKNQASEFITWLPSEGQLVQRTFVLFCTRDTWRGEIWSMKSGADKLNTVNIIVSSYKTVGV